MVYLKPEQIIQDSTIRVAPNVLKELNEFHPSQAYLTNLSATPTINSTNFELDTDFRLIQATERSICQKVAIVIIGSKDVFMFEMSIPGCVGELQQYIDGQMLSGKHHDFSKLGIAPIEWNNFKVSHQNNQLTLFINQQLVYQQETRDDIGLIGGAQFAFEGIVEVGQLQIQDEAQEVDFLD